MEIRPIISALLRSKTAPLLVAIQVAISLAILANALFLVHLRIAATERPSGIDDEATMAYLRVSNVDKQSHNKILANQARELAAIRAVPGVVSASLTSQMPMSRSGSSSSVRANMSQVQSSGEPGIYLGDAGLVRTLGLKLIEGRDLNEGDMVEMDLEKDSWHDKFPRTGIVTQALAQKLFPGATSFVGRTFFFGMGQGLPVRVVGVVERLQTSQAQSGAAGEYSVLLPRRVSFPTSRYAIRTEAGQRDVVLAAAEAAVRKSAQRLVRVTPRTVTEDRKNRYRNEKAMAWMLIAVSAMLLLVTVSGIVGMTSLRVAQRRKQLGVRRALGARWRDIMRYFVTENLIITTAGVVAGLLGALALNQLLGRQFELGRLPFEYLAIGAGALWLLGVAAVWGPASRAASTPPAIATRTA